MDINQQIAAAEAKRQQALQAEQQRLATEASARNTAAAAQADISRLTYQREMNALDERNKIAQLLVEAINALSRQLLTKLRAFDIAGTMEIGDQIDKIAVKLRDYNKQTLAATESLNRWWWEDALQQARVQLPNASPGSRMLDDFAISIFQETKMRFEKRLPVSLDFRGHIATWVSETEWGTRQRQIREGFAFSLTGWFCDEADKWLSVWNRPNY